MKPSTPHNEKSSPVADAELSRANSTIALEHEEHHAPRGLARWIYSTNHKDIGTLYLWFSFIMFLTGGAMAMIIRAELFQPGLQLVDPQFFNQMTTVHGLIMVFGAVMPAFTG
ncbi:cytochrome c oxidase polypeptide I [Vibrio ponticus]|nr:cytochrome c oxidase polypeptide I [Vibrio ponticus]